MSNQDEPVDGPTGEYRKELAEEVERRKKGKGEVNITEDIGNESVS